jgi:hypothetical protein
MTDAQVAAAQAAGGPILHIPITCQPWAIHNSNLRAMCLLKSISRI